MAGSNGCVVPLAIAAARSSSALPPYSFQVLRPHPLICLRNQPPTDVPIRFVELLDLVLVDEESSSCRRPKSAHRHREHPEGCQPFVEARRARHLVRHVIPARRDVMHRELELPGKSVAVRAPHSEVRARACPAIEPVLKRCQLICGDLLVLFRLLPVVGRLERRHDSAHPSSCPCADLRVVALIEDRWHFKFPCEHHRAGCSCCDCWCSCATRSPWTCCLRCGASASSCNLCCHGWARCPFFCGWQTQA